MRRALLVVLGLVAAAAVVYILFTIVFPWVDQNFVSDPVLGVTGILTA